MTDLASLPNLITSDTIVRVSSTLDKSVGKKYLTDGSQETCWSSANGLPQSITLTFPSAIIPERLLLTFAGGFVGTHCSLSYIPLASTTTSSSSSSSSSSSAPMTIEGPSGTSSSSTSATATGSKWKLYSRFFPEDVNRKQLFDISRAEGEVAAAAAEAEASSSLEHGGNSAGISSSSSSLSSRAEGEVSVGTKEIKIEFEKGSDFFGRITVYELALYGRTVM